MPIIIRQEYIPPAMPEDERCPCCKGEGKVKFRHTFLHGWDYGTCSGCNGSGYAADYYRLRLLECGDILYAAFMVIIKRAGEPWWKEHGWRLGKLLIEQNKILSDARELLKSTSDIAKGLVVYNGSPLEAAVDQLLNPPKKDDQCQT